MPAYPVYVQPMPKRHPDGPFDIFLIAVPGFEATLAGEVRAAGFDEAKAIPGGVLFKGCWSDVWRANLVLRGASRVLARLDSFKVDQLADLERRARRVPWSRVLRADVPVHVETTCHRSRIFHSGAASERIAEAITRETGAPISDDADITIKARFDNDICTIAVDTSGDLLHKRGHKQAVAKAPMRETLASLFLRECGYDGREPVLDPMCGSGTFVIEAAEMAAGLLPGRGRAFAFEQLATFDAAAWDVVRTTSSSPLRSPNGCFHGSDRDAGAIVMCRANAERAGVTACTSFSHHAVSDLQRPDGPPGLVIVNPPYGGRIGDPKKLGPLYQALGRTLMARFAGWRVGLVTNEATLAKATGLPFEPPFGPVSHGGIRVWLNRTAPLPAAS